MNDDTGVMAFGTDELCLVQVGKLKYLDAVVRESMRVHPVAALGSYRTSGKHEIKLKNGMTIPPQSTVMIPFFLTQRRHIKDPLSYNPDRWVDADSADAKQLKDAYMPFSLGKRNCIGSNLAMLEIRMIIATLAQRFSLELTAEPVATHFLTLKPLESMIRATPRSPSPKSGLGLK